MAQSEEATFTLPDLIPESSVTVEEIDGAANDQGYVYCIAECERGYRTGYFKVGTTSDPRKRLGDLQTGNVRQLQFWGKPRLVRQRLTIERKAHEALSNYAVYLNGGTEWFKAETESEQRDFYNRFCQATN